MLKVFFIVPYEKFFAYSYIFKRAVVDVVPVLENAKVLLIVGARALNKTHPARMTRVSTVNKIT